MRKLETGLEMVRAVCYLQWEWRGFREMLKVIEWTRPGGKIDTQWDKEQSGMILSSNLVTRWVMVQEKLLGGRAALRRRIKGFTLDMQS